jgi:YVTN family beta-propeller protein
MGHSAYVGRIGGLAVVLGVGLAVAAPAGVALAAPAESTTPSDPSKDTNAEKPSGLGGHDEGAPDTATGDTGVEEAEDQDGDAKGEAPAPESPSAATVEVAPGVKVSSSGGAHTSGDGADAGKKNAKSGGPKRPLGAKKAPAPAAAVAAHSNEGADDGNAASALRTAAPDATADVSADSFAMAFVSAPPVEQKAAASPVTLALDNVVRPLLSSFLGAIPGLPTESPLSWIFLAASRREVGQPELRTMAAEDPVAFTTAAVVANQPPTVGATFETPVATTGAISGQVVGTDPEGTAVTYVLTTPPMTGTLVFDKTTAKFTYTPTTAQRISAGVTPATDTIAMTVTVSDGTTSVPAVINIPVSPAPITKLADIGSVNDAHAVVATDTRAYVTNRTAGTVTIIDTTTNSVIGTVAVGPTPDGLAIKPDGTKLYVTSRDNNTVTVVDTTTKAIVKTIAVAKPSAIGIN